MNNKIGIGNFRDLSPRLVIADFEYKYVSVSRIISEPHFNIFGGEYILCKATHVFS